MIADIKQLLESYYKNKQQEIYYTRLAVEEGARQEVTANVWTSDEFPYMKRNITIIVDATDKRKMREYNEKLFYLKQKTIPVENFIGSIFDFEMREIFHAAYEIGPMKDRWVRVKRQCEGLGFKPISEAGYKKKVQRYLEGYNNGL